MRTVSLRRSGQTRVECREALRHLWLRDFVEPYVDGELASVRRARFTVHLTRCWTCSVHVETLQLIKRSLRTGPKRGPTPLAEVRLRRFADRLATTETDHGRG